MVLTTSSSFHHQLSEESDTNKVMTLINIKKGAELTVNYYFSITDERGEFCLTTAERWIKIMTMYHFECLCHECLQVSQEQKTMHLHIWLYWPQVNASFIQPSPSYQGIPAMPKPFKKVVEIWPVPNIEMGFWSVSVIQYQENNRRSIEIGFGIR